MKYFTRVAVGQFHAADVVRCLFRIHAEFFRACRFFNGLKEPLRDSSIPMKYTSGNAVQDFQRLSCRQPETSVRQCFIMWFASLSIGIVYRFLPRGRHDTGRSASWARSTVQYPHLVASGQECRAGHPSLGGSLFHHAQNSARLRTLTVISSPGRPLCRMRKLSRPARYTRRSLS